MTLVVARAFSDGPRILGDTQLTDTRTALNAYSQGALKVVVMHPHLTVAFAGGATTALDAINTLPVSTSGFDLDDVCRTLRRTVRKCRGGVDFIVAALVPERALLKIDQD